MTRGRRIAVGLGVGLAIALVAVALVLRAGRGREGSEGQRAAAVEPPSFSPTPTPTPTQMPASNAGEQSSRDAGTSDVTHVLRATDAHDRALLAGIERQTKASPPETVYRLIELRRNGASRDELQAFIDRELSGRFPIRVATQRWLRAVMPRPGLDAAPAPPPRMGSGGGPKLLQPIAPARPR